MSLTNIHSLMLVVTSMEWKSIWQLNFLSLWFSYEKTKSWCEFYVKYLFFSGRGLFIPLFLLIPTKHNGVKNMQTKFYIFSKHLVGEVTAEEKIFVFPPYMYHEREGKTQRRMPFRYDQICWEDGECRVICQVLSCYWFILLQPLSPDCWCLLTPRHVCIK